MYHLKELRTSKGLTQSELAKLLKISASAIGMYEQGRREPDYATLSKLANYFNVATDYLLGLVPSADAPSQPPAPSTASQPLTPQDRELLRKYHELDPRGKQAVLDTLEREHSYTAPQIEDKAT